MTLTAELEQKIRRRWSRLDQVKPRLEFHRQRKVWTVIDQVTGSIWTGFQTDGEAAFYARAHDYVGDLVDFKLEAAEVAIRTGHSNSASNLIEELGARSVRGQPDLSCELNLLRGLLAWQQRDERGAHRFLRGAQRRARNRKKLRLADRCDRIIGQIKADRSGVKSGVPQE